MRWPTTKRRARMTTQLFKILATLFFVMGAVTSLPHDASAAEPRTSTPRHLQAGTLLNLLSAPHPQVDGRALHKIGPDINDLLVEYATDIHASAVVRMRSLAWLQYFPTVQTRAVLMETLNARETFVPTLRVVLRALAYAFGSEVLPVVREHLKHRDLYVREAAAYALGDIRDRRVRDILVDHLQREPELAVRDACVSALKQQESRQ